MAIYDLPELGYSHDALEPVLTERMVELHHDKHHAAYVKGANDTLDLLAQARQSEDFGAIAGLERALAFNVSGHVLHSVLWKNLSPDAASRPTGDLAAAIKRDLGSFDSARSHLAAAATTIQGSGWAALVWEPCSGRLQVAQVHDHQASLHVGSQPLLVIDGWEHAYYLKYETDKEAYVDALWQIIDWDDVAARFSSVH